MSSGQMDEVEVKDFYFRQLRKIRIGDIGVPGDARCSLLCSSNEFGLTFIGCSKGVLVFKTSVLYTIDKDDSIGATNVIADGSLLKSTLISTPSPPVDVALSCDSITLSVCLHESGVLKCYFYDTRSLAVKGASLTPFSTITLSTTNGVQLSCLHWNPQEYPEQLAVSTSDGTLQMLAVIDDARVQQQKFNLHANAVCWSPKGKQVAVGLETGAVLQLSPSKNLEQRKSYPCPDIFNGEPHRVSDLYWVSTHVFAVVYAPCSPTNNTPSLVFVFTPKDQPLAFVNCEDVYYGGGNKKNKFYFTYFSAWGVFISCSSNALETVVHSHDPDNNTRWVQWELEDTGRAELPLEGSEETYAAGIALDLTSQQEVHVTESLVLPPAPLLLLYSDHGVLCPFTMINKDTASAIKLKELVKPAKPLPSDPRLVRQPKPAVTVAQESPACQAPSATIASSTNTSTSAPPQSQPPQQQQQRIPPLGGAGGGLNLTSTLKAPFSQSASGVGKISMASPLAGGLSSQPPSFGQAPTLGQLSSPGQPPSLNLPSNLGQLSSFGQPPRFSQPSSLSQPSGLTERINLGQPSPLTNQLGLKPGQVPGSVMASQQQPQQRPLSGGPVFGGSGIAGSGLTPSSFPFSVGSLAAGSPSMATNKSPPQQAPPATSSPQQQQQLQQQKKQSPPSLLQTSVHPPSATLTPGTSIEGLRFAPGYLSQQKPPSITAAPLPGQPSAASASVSPAAVGGMMPKSVVLSSTPMAAPPARSSGLANPVASTLQLPSALSSSIGGPPSSMPHQSIPSSHPGLPPQQPQLPVRPLHSSTPLAHPVGLHPQPRPPPPPHPLSGVSGGPLGTAAHPSPLLSGMAAPLSVRMAAPKPMGNTQGPPTAGQSPRPAVHSTYQSPPLMGVRPTLVPKQPPAYGYGSSPPMTGGASVPPRTAHPPPSSAPADDESLGCQDQLESKFAAYIQNEIERYTSDLESLKDDMRDMFGEWESVEGDKVKLDSLGGMDQLRELREEAGLVERELFQSADNFKSFEVQCSQLLEDTLKVYEMQAEAKANLRKKADPSYAALLKVRPLDAYSSQRLNDVRANFIKTKQSIGEINSQLDTQLEKKYEEKRQVGRRLLKVPSIQMVYSTLRDHRRITRVQNATVDKLTRDMKQLKLIPQSWQPSDAMMPRIARTPPTPLSPKTPTDVANGYGEEGTGKGVWSPLGRQKQRQPSGGDVMQTPVIEKMVGSERLIKLRESLSNITQTPVRTLHSAPIHTLSELQSDTSSVQSSSIPDSGRQSPQPTAGVGLHNGSEPTSFISEPAAPLNQTRVLAQPPQQFISPPSFVPNGSESVHSLAAGSSTTAAAGSLGTPTPQGSAPQSLVGSQSSLRSFNPDIVVGGSQRDIAVRMGSSFTNVNLLAARPTAQQPPYATERQYSIDAHADPHGQIAITTKRGSRIQKDLSPQSAPQHPATVVVPSAVPLQRSPLSVGATAPRWGSPPFSSAQPKPTTSPLAASLSLQAPTSISPKQGGTVSWGVPPATTVGESKPKQTIPPPPTVSTTQTKPAAPRPPPPNGGLNLAHSSSAPSLIKPQNNKSVPFLGPETVKNGLPQPLMVGQAFPSLKFGGSTNPLGELKRSEPVGDLTQIRMSTQQGSSPSAPSGIGEGGGAVSGLIGHESSSASVPNIALTTNSDTPPSLGIKFTSSLSSGLTVPATYSTIPPPTFTIGSLSDSQKLPTGTSVGSSGPPPSSTSFLSGSTTASLPTKPFTTGPVASLPTASKPVSSTAPASKPVFLFPGGSPQFTFSIGSTMAPSFTMGGQGQAPKTITAPTPATTTHTTSASVTATTTTGQPSGAGSIFSSMPKFSFGTGSLFQFSASTSAAPTSSAPTPFNTSGLGSSGSLKFPFSSQTSPPQTTSAAAAITTKPLPVTTLGGSLSSPLLSTSTATTKPFSFAMPGSSSFVFGDKSGGASLSSLLPKMADPSRLQEKGQQKENKAEEGGEIASSGGSTDGSGGEDQPPPPTPSDVVKPKDIVTKQTLSTAAEPLMPAATAATLTSVEKLPTESVSKAISSIDKSTAALRAPPSESESNDKDSQGNGAMKPTEEGIPKSEDKAERKPSPPPLLHGSTTETKAEVQEHTVEASKPILESGVSVVKVDEGDKERTKTAPLLITTTVPPVPAQPPQSITTTTVATSDEERPSPQVTTNLPKDSKQELPLIAASKEEDSVDKTSTTGAEAKEKQPLVEKPLVEKPLVEKPLVEKPTETMAASGVSFIGMQQQQPKMSSTESQGPQLNLDDIDNEADMEGDGEMEDASQDLSGPSSLFLGGGGGTLGGLGGLGGRPSNTTANPFGGGGMAAIRSPPGIGGGFMNGSTGSGSGLLKPSALGSSVISPPKFGTSSGRGLFAPPPNMSQQSSASSSTGTGMGSSGFGAGPTFGSSPGLGSGLGGFGSPPQMGGQSTAPARLFGSVQGGSVGPSVPFGGLSSGGGGEMFSFGGLAQQQQQQGQSATSFAQVAQQQKQPSSSLGGGASFSQWR